MCISYAKGASSLLRKKQSGSQKRDNQENNRFQPRSVEFLTSFQQCTHIFNTKKQFYIKHAGSTSVMSDKVTLAQGRRYTSIPPVGTQEDG